MIELAKLAPTTSEAEGRTIYEQVKAYLEEAVGYIERMEAKDHASPAALANKQNWERIIALIDEQLTKMAPR